MQQLYSEFAGEAGDITVSTVVKLCAPEPHGLTEADLIEYKRIIPAWTDCRALGEQCPSLAIAILREVRH